MFDFIENLFYNLIAVKNLYYYVVLEGINMKKLNLYQKYAAILFLSCIGFAISYLICIYSFVELKTLISICSIFLLGIIFSFIGFYFSYNSHINSLKQKNLKISYQNIIYIDISFDNHIIILSKKYIA